MAQTDHRTEPDWEAENLKDEIHALRSGITDAERYIGTCREHLAVLTTMRDSITPPEIADREEWWEEYKLPRHLLRDNDQLRAVFTPVLEALMAQITAYTDEIAERKTALADLGSTDTTG